MFVRFRQTPTRLQVSLVETRRAEGKVKHEHIASLGSIASHTLPDRVSFWVRLHERLAKLSNRVAPETRGKVLGDIHARIPMVTLDEQRALQLENAQADAKQWSGILDMNVTTVWERQGLAATIEARSRTAMLGRRKRTQTSKRRKPVSRRLSAARLLRVA